MNLRAFLWPEKKRIFFLLFSILVFFGLPFFWHLTPKMLIVNSFWVLQFYLISCFLFSRKNLNLFLLFLAVIVLPYTAYMVFNPYAFSDLCPLVEPCSGPMCPVAFNCNLLLYRLIDVLYFALLSLSVLAYVVLWLLDKRKKKP
jgi:hypothetical protein